MGAMTPLFRVLGASWSSRPRPRRLLASVFLAVGLALTVSPLAAAQEDGRPRVLMAKVKGVITPVIANFVEDAVVHAERERYDAFLIQLDTPGGLETSMREIVQSLLNSQVPTIVYVGPAGSRAASAGAIITLAPNVAAMSPGTTIGAATPVDLEGGDISRKIIQDAAAYAESLAEARGRDVDFARNAVLEAESITEREALARGVVEIVADDVREVLDEIHGWEVTMPGDRVVTLETAGAVIDEFEMGFFRSIQQWLADPNLAFLFLSLGSLAIIYEVANPGVGLGGILGAIALVLAFFALSVLPVNAVGVLFLILAFALFVAELFVPGVGVMAAGGVVSLALAGVFLFRGSVGVDPYVIWPTIAVVGGGTLLIGRWAWRSRRAPQASGAEALVGRTVEVRTVGERGAQVYLEGALWRARRRDGNELEVGQRVQVFEVDGLDVIVEPVGGSEPADPGAVGSATSERMEGP